MHSAYVTHVLYRGTEAGWAYHRTVGASEASRGDIVPARVLEILVKEIFDAGVVDVAHLLPRRCFDYRFRLPKVLFRSWGSLQFGKQLRPTLASYVYKEEMPVLVEEFSE